MVAQQEAANDRMSAGWRRAKNVSFARMCIVFLRWFSAWKQAPMHAMENLFISNSWMHSKRLANVWEHQHHHHRHRPYKRNETLAMGKNALQQIEARSKATRTWIVNQVDETREKCQPKRMNNLIVVSVWQERKLYFMPQCKKSRL